MKKYFLFICFIICVTKSNAQFTIEPVLSAPFPTELKASPIGNKVAWVFNQQGSQNIFVAEAPDSKAIKITNYEGDNGQEINSLTFTTDGNSIVFIRESRW